MRWQWVILFKVLVVLALVCQGQPVGATTAPAPQRRSRDISQPTKPRPKNLGSRGMIPKKKRRGNTSPGRTHGGKAMAEAKRALDREALPQDWTWYQQMWSRIIFFLFWPFQWLNVTYGPIASNAFGFLVIFLAMFAPGLFEDKADRELKLKERVVIAKNTRVRVRAAQSVEAYQNAVHQITDEDLAYPLKNLRKMLRLPPADPASYSQVRYPLSGLFPAHIRSSLSNSLPSLSFLSSPGCQRCKKRGEKTLSLCGAVSAAPLACLRLTLSPSTAGNSGKWRNHSARSPVSRPGDPGD